VGSTYFTNTHFANKAKIPRFVNNLLAKCGVLALLAKCGIGKMCRGTVVKLFYISFQ